MAGLTEYIIMPGTHYKQACDKIREKTGKTDIIKSGDLANEIESIPMFKTYTLVATFSANYSILTEDITCTIEVVRQYNTNGTYKDFILRITSNNHAGFNQAGEVFASSVTNLSQYDGNVASGIITYGTFDTMGEGDEYFTATYALKLVIEDGKVCLYLDDGDAYGYYNYTFVLSVEYDITNFDTTTIA